MPVLAETFSIGNSFFHRLDPRIRVFVATVLSITIALSKKFETLFLALILASVLLVFARLQWSEVLKRLTVVVGFAILIWLMLPLTFEGEVLFVAGPLKIFQPGVRLSAQISLKTLSILMVFITFMATMTVATLGHTLTFFRLPEKLILLLLITYRYLFVIGEEYSRLRTAMSIRGFKPGTNIHSFKTFAYLIGMLFVRASVRAERVSQAMRLRGFKGRFYSLQAYSSYQKSPLFLIAMGIIFSVMLVIEWNLYEQFITN